MSYTGKCACGGVEIEIEGPPRAVRQCWCRRCQRMSGGGPAHNAMFATEAVAITGTLAQTGYTADSGAEITWEFCPTCGTPVYVHADVRPHLRIVRLGMLDQPNDLRPQAVIWTSEAPAWAVFDPALPQYAMQVPPTTKQP